MRYDWIYLIEKLNRRRSDLNISSENELISNINNNVLSNEDLLEAFKELRLKLGEHMRLGHVIFLFGNGTSIYAGSKSTMDFTLQKYAQNTEFVGIIGRDHI